MKVIFTGRRTGKTTNLILESHEKNMPIVYSTSAMAHCAMSQAREMNISIPTPVLFQDIVDGRLNRTKHKGFLFDELQITIGNYVQMKTGANIETATITDHSIPDKRWKDE